MANAISSARRPLLFIALTCDYVEHPPDVTLARECVFFAQSLPAGGGFSLFGGYLGVGTAVFLGGVRRDRSARLLPDPGQELVLLALDACIQLGTALLRSALHLARVVFRVQDGAQERHVRRRFLFQLEPPGLVLACNADLLLGLEMFHGIQTADLLGYAAFHLIKPYHKTHVKGRTIF